MTSIIKYILERTIDKRYGNTKKQLFTHLFIFEKEHFRYLHYLQ